MNAETARAATRNAIRAARGRGEIVGIRPSQLISLEMTGWSAKQGWLPNNALIPSEFKLPGADGEWRDFGGVEVLIQAQEQVQEAQVPAELVGVPVEYREAFLSLLNEEDDLELVGFRWIKLTAEAPADALMANGWYTTINGVWLRRDRSPTASWRTIDDLPIMVSRKAVEEADVAHERREARPYQASCIEEVAQGWDQGKTQALILSSTGSGKSYMLSRIAERWLARHPEAGVLLLVNRRKLISQNRDALIRDGGLRNSMVGELMGGRTPGRGARVIVSTVQSAHRAELPAGPLLAIMDEAHVAGSAQYQTVLDRLCPDALLGVTATPSRKSGRSLKDIFGDNLVTGLHDYEEGFRRGWLVPPVWYVPAAADVQQARQMKNAIRRGKIEGGDLSAEVRADIIMQAKVFGSIVEHILREASDRKGIVFCESVELCHGEAQAMREAGLTAEVITGETPEEDRIRLFRDYEYGDLNWLVSVDVLAVGVDLPICSCIVLARPTRSPVLLAQMVGRGLRQHPGKQDCLVIDHCGSLLAVGDITTFSRGFWERLWGKVGNDAIKESEDVDIDRDMPAAEIDIEEREHTCRCGTTWIGGPQCPACNRMLQGRVERAANQWALNVQLKRVQSREEAKQLAGSWQGDVAGLTPLMTVLQDKNVERRRRTLQRQMDANTKEQVFRQLIGWSQGKGKGPRIATEIYEKTMGEPISPDWKYVPEAVSSEVREMVRKFYAAQAMGGNRRWKPSRANAAD